MDIIQMIYNAQAKNEFIDFLCGSEDYMVEPSQYAPGADITDVGKVLSKGVYKIYSIDNNIKKEYEESLLKMTNISDFHIYMVCNYLLSQLFKEKMS